MKDFQNILVLLKKHPHFNPWPYFCLFLASNVLLSYFSLPPQAILWIGWMGLFLPFLLGIFFGIRTRKLKDVPETTFEKTIHLFPFFWILFFVFFVFSRFYRLSSIPFWPLTDEGIFSFLAIGLMKKWSTTLLWAQGQMEPLLLWLLALFYRWVGVSLLTQRFFTVLISIAIGGSAYAAAKRVFEPFLAFVFCWFVTLSFWEIGFSRQCTPNDLIPLFQLIAFILLGILMKTQRNSNSWFWTVVLGIWCGFGFYSYTNWIVAWLFFAMVIFSYPDRIKRSQGFLFIVLSLALSLPLVLARFAPGATQHLQENVISSSFFSSFFSYLRGFFLNGKDSYPLGPIWGGYFDAVTGTLVLNGILYSARCLDRKVFFLLVSGTFLSLFPGILSNGLELQRATPVFIFFMLFASFGLRDLFTNISFPLRKWAFLGLLLTPTLLNFYHFFNLYDDIRLCGNLNQQWRNFQYYDAYRILKAFSKPEGSLNLFTEFNTDYVNRTLDVACYPFDAIHNPSLRNPNPSWTALITNAHYAPYFEKRFPGVRWKILDTDKRRPEDPKPFAVFLIPTAQIPPPMLEAWKSADRVYGDAQFEVMNKRQNERWASFLESRPTLPDSFPADRFLTAVYWEKLAFFKVLDGHFVQATQAFKNAIHLGIPAAQLYYNLGLCLQFQKRDEESKKSFV